MSGKNAKENREKYLAEYDDQINKNFPGNDLDEEAKNYFRCLAETYYSGETDGIKLQEYLKEMLEDPKQRNIVLSTIKRLKIKYSNEVKQAPQPIKKPKKEIAKDNDEAKEGQQDVELKEGLKKQLEKEGKQKCRFFPFCKNEESCQYFHPKQKVIQFEFHLSSRIKKLTPEAHLKINEVQKKLKKQTKKIKGGASEKVKNLQQKNTAQMINIHQCTYFPHCKHGDNCLYVHEACKFKQKCTRPNCQYAHPFRKNSNPIEMIIKSMIGNQNPFKNKKKNFKQPHKQSNDENGAENA